MSQDEEEAKCYLCDKPRPINSILYFKFQVCASCAAKHKIGTFSRPSEKRPARA